MDHAHRGEAALTAGKHEDAVTHFSEAIKQSPTAATYYIKRSTAYQRTLQYKEALQDADIAVVLATKREKRELIAQAQLRRGIALFNLERYGDAAFVFGIAKKWNDKEKLLGIWDIKVRGKLEALEQADVAKREVTVKETPEVELPKVLSKSTSFVASPAQSPAANTNSNLQGAKVNEVGQTPAGKIRHDWYQNAENVYFTLLAKGVPQDQATIEIQERSVSISFPLSNGATYDFSLEPLFALVDATNSTYKILSTKVELVLKKSAPGQKWSALESTTADIPNATIYGDPSDDAVKNAVLSPPPSSGPVYPTSSRSGPKNWDKIANSYNKPGPSATKAHGKGKTTSKDESTSKEKSNSGSDSDTDEEKDAANGPNGDIYIDENDEDGDEVNGFFKKLYKDASPDVRRAMVKSYQESGGTALSTNWSEVAKKTVPISPPDGMEAKKWEI